MNNINRLIDHQEFDHSELKEIIYAWPRSSNKDYQTKVIKSYVYEGISLLSLLNIEHNISLPFKLLKDTGNFEVTDELYVQFKNVLLLAWVKLNNLSSIRVEPEFDTMLYQGSINFDDVSEKEKTPTRELFKEISEIMLSDEAKDILSFECRLSFFSSDPTLDYNTIARKVHSMTLRRYLGPIENSSEYYESLINLAKDIELRVGSTYSSLEFVELLEKYKRLFK